MRNLFIKFVMVLSGLFIISSCVKDVKNNEFVNIPDKQQQYENAFANAFGNVNSNVNWGFDDIAINVVKNTKDNESNAAVKARRAHNVNLNQWGTSDAAFYFPENVTAEEEAAVLAYFEGLPRNIENTININWTDFFVYQVHKGTTMYKDGNNTEFVASDKMNQLWCYKQPNMVDGEHVNNFNNGNNTTIQKTEARSYHGEYEIKGGTFMWNSGTADFSYSNSNESGRHYNDYVIVSGNDVFKGNPEMRQKYGEFYYVGFDYRSESSVNKDII